MVSNVVLTPERLLRAHLLQIFYSAAYAFGTRLFAAATGRRGGRRKSKAKAVAAKANGAKGGRPRKRLSA
jgi:hypothetical protein